MSFTCRHIHGLGVTWLSSREGHAAPRGRGSRLSVTGGPQPRRSTDLRYSTGRAARPLASRRRAYAAGRRAFVGAHLTRDDLDLGVDLLATKLAEGLDGGNGGDIRATEEAERNAEDHLDDRPRGHAHVVIDPAVGPHVPRPDELDATNHCRDSRLARANAASGLRVEGLGLTLHRINVLVDARRVRKLRRWHLGRGQRSRLGQPHRRGASFLKFFVTRHPVVAQEMRRVNDGMGMWAARARARAAAARCVVDSHPPMSTSRILQGVDEALDKALFDMSKAINFWPYECRWWMAVLVHDVSPVIFSFTHISSSMPQCF